MRPVTRSSSRRRSASVGLATLGLLGASTLFGATGASGLELPESTTFVPTGAPQTYVVPENVCSVAITAVGGQGGAGSNRSPDGLGDVVPGGLGGVAQSSISVTPGEELGVYVGGAGGNGTWEPNPRTIRADVDEAGDGGWNGGGEGGHGGIYGGGGGGGGGGASDVRQGGDSLDDRIVVGGGGGGGGAYTDPSDLPAGKGGVGGNPATAGGDGVSNGDHGVAVAAGGGGAATVDQPGAGGVGGTYSPVAPAALVPQLNARDDSTTPFPGASGSAGIGGDGGTVGTVDDAPRAGGGGGGAGLYGGGGGGAAATLMGGGGGGGSSLGDVTFAGGEAVTIDGEVYPEGREGPGIVVIAPDGDCPTTTTTAPDTTVDGTDESGAQAPVATPVSARPDYTG